METHRFISLSEVKIHAVSKALDAEAARVRVVFQQQLLQVVERSFVVHPLPHLKDNDDRWEARKEKVAPRMLLVSL